MNTTSNCFIGYPSNVKVYYSLPFSAVSLLPSLATVIFVCVLKLHKTLVYRLALYQVLSAMEFSVVWIAVGAFALHPAHYYHQVNVTSYWYYNNTSYTDHYSEYVDQLAPVFEALLLGSTFIKLMFTVWIVIHLFALAVFHKNLKRLEPLYVVSSLLVTLIVTATLLVMNLVPSRLQEACRFREDIVYTIIFSVLVLTSLLIVVMGTILCHRACRRRSLALSEYDKQHKKVLYEMLPLLLYPILFLLITTPIFGFAVLDFTVAIYRLDDITSSIYFTFAICAPLWSFTTSLLLIFHLCVVRHVKKKNLQRIKNALNKVRRQREAEEGSVTVNETTRLCQRSDTHFTSPIEE